MNDDADDDAYDDVDVDVDVVVDGDDVDEMHLSHQYTAHRYHTSHRCHLHLLQPFGSHHYPRGFLFPFSFSSLSLRPFPFRPGVRVELRASQD